MSTPRTHINPAEIGQPPASEAEGKNTGKILASGVASLYNDRLSSLKLALWRAYNSTNQFLIEAIMKADIHPEYSEIKVSCSCGNEFNTRSTLGQALQVEVCSGCHPFYTGKQKLVDTGGRVDKFRKRYSRG